MMAKTSDNMDNHHNTEEATMRNTLTFDVEAAAAARRSWEEATPAEQEAMLKPQREAYRQERALRGALEIYLTNLAESLEGRAVEPWSLTATAAVVRIAGVLGAIHCATSTGRPRVLVDNNAVTYYAEDWTSGDNVELSPDPVIDPLLEELADVLGCSWVWIGDAAIELVVAS
jgi:hypothetical protein